MVAVTQQAIFFCICLGQIQKYNCIDHVSSNSASFRAHALVKTIGICDKEDRKDLFASIILPLL